MTTKEELLKQATRPAEIAIQMHYLYRGKMQMMPKCAVRDYDDFATWYTPGVAAPCRAIHDQPELVYQYTSKANTIAVVSDGTRVLGLGDIGPEAGLPVMEGKSLLFKYLGGVDAVPLCLGTRDPEELVRTVRLLEPTFGGINLEDISQPKCFDVLEQLRNQMQIPVWHDDQQGSATVTLAGLIGALKIVDKPIDSIRIAMIGMGAANISTFRLLKSAGVDPAAIVACDSRGTLHRGREDVERAQEEFTEKWQVCLQTNEQMVVGGIGEALNGADVCIAFSAPGPNVIRPEFIKEMADKAIVFACANPIPEIWPWEAKAAGARIVATGRSDFPNQVNNALGFPGIFRGVLDVQAKTITDAMAMAAARALAQAAEAGGLSETRIVPRLDEWDVVPQVSVATALQAQKEGVAVLSKTGPELLSQATKVICQARKSSDLLLRSGIIAEPKENE